MSRDDYREAKAIRLRRAGGKRDKETRREKGNQKWTTTP